MILDIKPLIEKTRNEIKSRVEILGIKPELHIISVGDNQANASYIRSKARESERVGVKCVHHHYDTLSTEGIKTLICKLNEEETVNGIMVQLPMTEELMKDKTEILDTIATLKDVDGLSTKQKICHYMGAKQALVPATAQGVMKIIKDRYYKGKIAGERVALLSRSELIGEPLRLLLDRENATTTVIHSKSNFKEWYHPFEDFDIIVSGIGQAETFNIFHFEEDGYYDVHGDGGTKLIVDCSMNRNAEGKLVGDFEKGPRYSERRDKWQGFGDDENTKLELVSGTGATGIMTVLMLMKNVVDAYKLQEDEYFRLMDEMENC